MRVVSELGEHPGTEDRPEPGLAQVDLGVRVPAKARRHLIRQHLDLGHQGLDPGDQRTRLEPLLSGLRKRIEVLEAENAALMARLSTVI